MNDNAEILRHLTPHQIHKLFIHFKQNRRMLVLFLIAVLLLIGLITYNSTTVSTSIIPLNPNFHPNFSLHHANTPSTNKASLNGWLVAMGILIESWSIACLITEGIMYYNETDLDLDSGEVVYNLLNIKQRDVNYWFATHPKYLLRIVNDNVVVFKSKDRLMGKIVYTVH